MTPKQYPEWTPDDLQPGDEPSVDPLSEQVAAREDERLLADPEIDAPPKIERVGNTPPQPIVNVELNRSVTDPSAAPVVEHVDATAHLKDRQPSTDHFAGSSQAIITPIGEEDR
jgi:hypothetical protein